jgi:phosphoribosylamine---glycine ligase
VSGAAGNPIRVMVVGSGGREHALAWKLAASARVSEVLAVPGNAGIAEVARCVAAELTPAALLEVAEREGVDFTVVGPEVPLVAGVADAFAAAGRRIFAPDRAAAQLEGSKAYAKAFMARHGIPTASYQLFTDLEEAKAHVETQGYPLVVKDSALAAGKGVTVAHTHAEALRALEGVLGAGGEVVVEEFLSGQELSLLLLCDGEAVELLPLAQDYKQAFDGDTGPMTGGMGVVAPVPLLTEAQLAEVMDTVVAPTLAGLRAEGVRYRGVLFVGLMLTAGGIRVLEYNVRFGDPETQAVLPLLESDLLELLEATAAGRLAEVTPRWSAAAAACVVLAAPGYPGGYPTGLPLSVPEVLPENTLVFHAGTARGEAGLVSSGGRVLNVVALAPTLGEAVAAAYAGVDAVDFKNAHLRRDIGGRLAAPLSPAQG